MMRPTSTLAMVVPSLAVAILCILVRSASAEFWLDEFTTDGDVRRDYDRSGRQVASLVLDQRSGAGFNSTRKYLFGEFSVEMKLVGGNSAGTVTSFYLTSGEGDEIDMEFMGNSSGSPTVLNTNVWANGDGKKEHQFYLWFDPAADFHKYKIVWNDKNIIFQVDDVTVRVFKRYDDLPYPDAKPMAVHATLWDGSYWATRKGEVKIDWSSAPFVVSYRDYTANACAVHGRNGGGSSSCPAGANEWMDRQSDDTDRLTVAWARRNCLQYNYCDDGWRFPQGFPGECARN
ncbi:Xyloglucan endotransglucosylase/hydrolase protein 2 [Zea mays]|uniref:Xyloglucan endotransglucosylase/hydrolase n=2 Tax=Zea mays TaxID=4577 RepID=B4FSS4_MAIZE|nr:unknown [Zea mays]ACR37629.1 unknown [Zea mays]AQK40643.1 Xyloglucan endotransglucosylase/hydrolase protein 2 [Zea mays]